MIPRLALAPDYSISRLVKGGWHLAGGHGEIDASQATRDMARFVEAGITTFDCADIYTGVEELIGRFRREHPALARQVRVHTKFVPDLDALAQVDARYVEEIIDRSLRRLGQERLDLVQFHWWDYALGDMAQAALHLDAMRREGKIAQLGVTNCDVAHLTAILDAGVPVVVHQVQCSLLDRRALGAMRALCEARGVRLLAYGALAGGFLHERWLGRPAPAEPLENRSLVKYRLIIEEWGGWEPLQALLRALHGVAARHQTTIGAVAVRWVLEQPQVASAIVGARHAGHLPATLAALDVWLDEADRSAIEGALPAGGGPVGDVYALERERGGRHAVIMRYGLNAAATE